jgi:hypothetical protein
MLALGASEGYFSLWLFVYRLGRSSRVLDLLPTRSASPVVHDTASNYHERIDCLTSTEIVHPVEPKEHPDIVYVHEHLS